MSLPAPNASRALRGKRAHLGGLAAEDQVERHYERQGMTVCARRWRGQAGEIDLVLRNGAEVIFVEVKSSRSHSGAAAHVSPAQVQRIFNTAAEFLDGEPRGQLTDMRVDLALVDGSGRIEILENAFAG